MEKKRLLKEMPFGDLKVGSVLTSVNGGYEINNGQTFYREGGSSSNGTTCFNGAEEDIITAVWNDKKWFEDADLKHIEIKAERSKIILEFEPLDLDDAQTLARGIQSCLTLFYGEEDSNYVWKHFKGFTTKVR